MDPRLCLLVVLLLAAVQDNVVQADFYFNHPSLTPEDVEVKELKCVPGRTILKISDKPPEDKKIVSGEDKSSEQFLRSHMNTGQKNEFCKICVCSTDGKDEYCSQRPAVNVNECMRMKWISERMLQPFDHTRTLAYRIRRDYTWHNDEIPYEPYAYCRRGHSFYTNKENFEEANLASASKMESLLDYDDKYGCYYCICSVSGKSADCISRDVWFCEYFRLIREKGAMRDRYKEMFQQDRPTYFRQLSWRLRRSMDRGMYDLLDTGMDAGSIGLRGCTSFAPLGFAFVFLTMRRYVVLQPSRWPPEESSQNSEEQAAGNEEEVGGGDVNDKETKCIPFVSEYSDCTEGNRCSGCNKCTCVGNNKWSCQPITDCPKYNFDNIDDNSLDTALYAIRDELEKEDRARVSTSGTPHVPQPDPDAEKDPLLGFGADIDERIRMLLRNKRSVDEHFNDTESLKFHHTDELKDTLAIGNLSGTITAHKVEAIAIPNKLSRRAGVLSADNLSKNSLHIEHNPPKVYDDNLADNKIDDAGHTDDKFKTLSHEKMNTIISNYTQKQKDKELSKLVVNELKVGTEVVGDKNEPVVSNITFTPENDTLTAMAFIAGNLLNKLWNMEKDSSEDSQEAEKTKKEKIADLLNLFKEPLNIRQENFLKSALEKLSEAVGKENIIKNFSMCNKVNEEIVSMYNNYETTEEVTKSIKYDIPRRVNPETTKEKDISPDTISKVKNVLTLINQLENVQGNLNTFKKPSQSSESIKKDSSKTGQKNIPVEDDKSLNMFGSILEKITKLLLPPKKSKKTMKSINSQNVYKNTQDIAKILKDLFNIEINDSKLSAKDKIVLDYLNAVQTNPKYVFDNLKHSNTKPATIEGNILLNLSEFFKIKSFTDLIKQSDLGKEPQLRVSEAMKMNNPETSTDTTTTTTTTSTTNINTSTTKIYDKLSNTKEKLKEHLKTIIEDLVELQNAKGYPVNNISIVDALPCIYNIMNADKITQNKVLDDQNRLPAAERITAIFDSLKKDLQLAQTRRSNIVNEKRPKSAVVWERIVQNLNAKRKQMSRRNMGIKESKSIEELKNKIDQIQSSSKLYKNQALIKGVPPTERKMFLKTLYEDIQQYIKIFEDINISFDKLKDLTADEKKGFNGFVENAASNINLDKNIAKNINDLKLKENGVQKPDYLQQKSMKMRNDFAENEKNNIKLSRDAVINQLIKNRIQLFIKTKESKGAKLGTDLHYDIAKKILVYLDNGNHSLARELYEVLISQKNKSADSTDYRLAVPTLNKQSSVFNKEAVNQFEDPKNQVQWLNQDAWMKQLENLKNMR